MAHSLAAMRPRIKDCRALTDEILKGYRQRRGDGINHLFYLAKVLHQQHGADKGVVGVGDRFGRAVKFYPAGAGNDRFASTDRDLFLETIKKNGVLRVDFTDMPADDFLVNLVDDAAGNGVDGIDNAVGINGNYAFAHAVE